MWSHVVCRNFCLHLEYWDGKMLLYKRCGLITDDLISDIYCMYMLIIIVVSDSSAAQFGNNLWRISRPSLLHTPVASLRIIRRLVTLSPSLSVSLPPALILYRGRCRLGLKRWKLVWGEEVCGAEWKLSSICRDSRCMLCSLLTGIVVEIHNIPMTHVKYIMLWV